MALRLLHTSDWHLGVSTGPASRLEDQRRFLTWLTARIEEREIDALLIAGDVFDTMHPGAEAQRLYFRFLAGLVGTGIQSVVVVGGNHDSASRLDAPRALLEAVKVHVVGGVPPEEVGLERMIAPLYARNQDDVAAVCLAVPYAHEYRLGIRTTDLDRDQTRKAFQERFARLYTDLADLAERRYPGVPMLCTGHLTVGTEVRRDDYPQEIHQVGTIEGLPKSIFDPRIRYAALGHIHRCYPIADSVAWYSGTPIPYALSEMNARRRVLEVDLPDGSEAGEVVVDKVEVPRFRDLIQLEGAPSEVVTELQTLQWQTEAPPLVHVRVRTDFVEPNLSQRLHDALSEHGEDRPILVEVKQHLAHAAEATATAPARSLEELQPAGVFELLCDHKKLTGESRDEVVSAFSSLLSATSDDVEAMIQAIPLVTEATDREADA